MSIDSARQALASLSDEEADLLNNSPDLLEKFKTKHGIGQTQKGTPLEKATQISQTITSPLASANQIYERSQQMAGLQNSPQSLLEQVPGYLSKGASWIGGKTSEQMSSQGVNPYLAAAAGTAISMAPDALTAYAMPPISELGEAAQEASSQTAGFAGKTLKQTARVLSGNKPKDIQAMFDQPEAFLAPTMKGAKKLYGQAVGKAEEAGGISTVSEEAAFDSAKEIAQTILKKVDDRTASTLDALEGRQNIDQIINSTKATNTPRLKKLYELRTKLDKVVKSDPNLAQADKVYEQSALASKFRSLLPVNLSGTPSVLKSLMMGYFHNPLMAVGMSPMTTGTAAAGLGLANKIAGPTIQSTIGAVGSNLPRMAGASLGLAKKKNQQ